MSSFTISDLYIRVAEQKAELISGLNLEINSGEIHALMGPNGSGKSSLAHALMGRSGYEITGGSASIDGEDLVGMPTFQRAGAGLFVAHQYPIEIPGVSLDDFLAASLGGQGRDPGNVAARLDLLCRELGAPDWFLDRSVNFEMSGGEKKRSEVIQLSVIEPKFAILDEIDSGLDVDALRLLSARIRSAVTHTDVGILAITHYTRLLEHLRPDFVHIFAQGKIVRSGGPELADELDATGYDPFLAALRANAG